MEIFYQDTLNRLDVRLSLSFFTRNRSSSCDQVSELPICISSAFKSMMCIVAIRSSDIMGSIIANILQVGHSRWTDYLSSCIMLDYVLLESDQLKERMIRKEIFSRRNFKFS